MCVEVPEWGSVALVSYIPDPLRSVLQKLRQALPGDHTPPPHITILPPRPLQLAVEDASKQAQNILNQVSAFEVELGTVRRFPETNFLYLAINAGDTSLRRLHDTLNAGVLHFGEEFEFRPHLTLGGPIPDEELDSVLRATKSAWRSAACSRRFTLDELVLLWIEPQAAQGEWRPLFSHCLETKNTMAQAAAASVTSRTL